MKKTSVVLLVLAVSMLAGGQVAWAGVKPFYANVNADAQCAPGINGWSELSVDADLIQKDAPSSGPFVSTVVFSLEQHSPKTNDWKPIAGSGVLRTVNKQFDLMAAGERYDVATQTYPDFIYPVGAVCDLVDPAVDPAANAVRAVVQITVTNANPKRPGGLVHTGRCISFPNPCR